MSSDMGKLLLSGFDNPAVGEYDTQELVEFYSRNPIPGGRR